MSCASASVDRPPAPVPSTIASNSLTLSAPAPCCLSRSRGRSVRGSSLILNVLLVGGPGCSDMHDLRMGWDEVEQCELGDALAPHQNMARRSQRLRMVVSVPE